MGRYHPKTVGSTSTHRHIVHDRRNHPFFTPYPEGKLIGSAALGTTFFDDTGAPSMPPQELVAAAKIPIGERPEVTQYFTGPNEPARSGPTEPEVRQNPNGPARDNPNPPIPSFDAENKDVPDYAQGPNECVPTSVMNSILWLAKKYGFTDRIPMDPVAVVNELKQDFKWKPQGVDVFQNFFRGKEAFFKRHNVPIVTHSVGRPFDPKMVEKIAAEIKKGQDVELVFEFYRRNAQGGWDVVGGHMVTVVAAWSQGQAQFLGFHDPGGPKNATSAMDVYQIRDLVVTNYRYRGDTVAYIRYAFAESPVPMEEFKKLTGDDQPKKPPAKVKNVDVLKIGWIYYPTSQFYVGTGPNCDLPHWHANTGSAKGLSLKGYIDLKDQDPYFIESRSATIDDWTDPEACGLGRIRDVPRMTIMMSEAEVKALGVK